jgi:glycosyltransferase involved in cell wall biosynthesis
LFYDVVERVIAANAEVRATVVGSGHDPGLLAARYPSAVENTSFRRHTEIDCDFLASFDLLLVTSPAEAFSLVLLEASACGLQFVSTDVGIARDLADRGLGRIASADADAFSEQVLTALAGVMECDMQSKLAQIRSIRVDYDAEVVSQGFEDLLRRVGGTTP